MRPFFISLLLYSLLVTVAPAAEVRLSVAASMANAIEDLTAVYAEEENGDVRFLTNFASSGSLARQISQGAPADLFISAHPAWMDYLVEQNLIPADRVDILAWNSLVLIGKKGTEVGRLADTIRLDRIAIGSPKSVPAGMYAVEALKAAGLYERMAGSLVMAKDVRQALVYADRGEVEGAFVYRSDARLARNAVILLEVPQELHGKVVYPVGLTREGVRNEAAIAFFEFLLTDEAGRILEKSGFTSLGRIPRSLRR